MLAASTNPPELAKRMRASQAGMMPGWRCLRIAMFTVSGPGMRRAARWSGHARERSRWVFLPWRVLASLHTLPVGQQFFEPPGLYRQLPAAEVVREYLAEIPRLIGSSDAFAVLAHIDYPVRYWPRQAGPFAPNAFEEEFRHAMRVLAVSGRALEVNTAVPLPAAVVRWWREEGGEAITFGSDAHDPALLASGRSRRRRPWLRLTGSDPAVIPLT